ncbi:MAG TPA: ATP-binding protein [Candidatus Saccharimonadales bacterium]|nr:ATP-binding protein [Candidatus Saccharimonadales bacterium]
MVRSAKIYFHFVLSIGISAIGFGFCLLFLPPTSPLYRPILFVLIIILVLNLIIHLILKSQPEKVETKDIKEEIEREMLEQKIHNDPALQPHPTPPPPTAQPVAPPPTVSPVSAPKAEESVSEEKQEALKDETVLANIGEGLVIINKLGRIITFNKAAQALLGWSQEEALGKNFADIVRIDFDNSLDTKNQTLGRQSSLHFIRKDGTKFPAAITTSSYVQGDNILGTITLFRDVTAEKNIDKMKNEFISLASHQLRTPLAAIKWYSKMLVNGDAGKLQPEQSEYAESIYTSTNRMIDLVNALLNITRIESGRIIVEPEPTDLKKMITEIVQEVKIRYVDKRQRVEFVCHDTLPLINIDPKLVRQVFVNLLTNAAKYTPEKGQIIVTTTKTDTEVITEVKDNGFGIPQSEQEKVFGKFYRGKNTIGGGSDGTGLGLYLVRSIVELSLGRIWFKSEENKGTNFWVSLPLSGSPAKKGVLTLEV